MKDTTQLHKMLINQIYNQDYYVPTFEKCASFDVDKVYNYTNEELICSFWSDFWYHLPDTPNIRRTPFFLVCDLAEGEYLEESTYAS
jgi:hypothetical protein